MRRVPAVSATCRPPRTCASLPRAAAPRPCVFVVRRSSMWQRNKYQLNPTQELRGLGLANLAGAMFNW